MKKMENFSEDRLILVVGAVFFKKSLVLHRFKLDWNEIWDDCSSSKYPLIDRATFLYECILSKWWPWCMTAAHSFHRLPASLPSAWHHWLTVCATVPDPWFIVVTTCSHVFSGNKSNVSIGLIYTRRHELHLLDIPEHIQFRTAVTVHRCLNGLAPAYLTELCIPIIQSRSSCRLRSSYRNRLAVPSVKLSIGSRLFSVSGPIVWNALPDYLRSPTLSIDVFKRHLKTFLFAQY